MYIENQIGGEGMLRRIVRAVLSLVGASIGIGIAFTASIILKSLNVSITSLQEITLIFICGIIFTFVFFIASPGIVNRMINVTKKIEDKLSEIPVVDIVYGSLGLIVGLLVAYLISSGPVQAIGINWLALSIAIAIYFIFSYLGISIAIKRREEISTYFHSRKINKGKVSKDSTHSKPKVLDTSVIIDGRIYDICKTGFLDGPLVIPGFVLEELRHIADSSDALKRNRGRRGLDILNKIQKELDITVKINHKDYPEIMEVDTKLLKLSHDLSAKVITNDYNLNKVAEFEGVPVLNINDLANAVKPVVIPGEEMKVQVIKDGKEMGQGVAYLDDGTMIVVDGGKQYVGQTIGVLVTSVLQTSAGRMIFAKPNVANRIVS